MSVIRQLAFVDAGVSGVSSLLAGLQPDVEAIVLDTHTPALAQIAARLRGRTGLEAIHVFAHGQPGEISFSSGAVSHDGLDEQAQALGEIGQALDGGALHLWSCEVADGSRGRRFVAALGQATGAPIAAATKVLGAARLGGTWRLDWHDEDVAPSVPLTAAAMGSYAGLLATKTWDGSSSQNWGTNHNWTPSGVPAAGNDVIIGNNKGTIDLNVDSASLHSLSIGTSSTLNVDNHTLTVAGTGVSLSGTISGSGTVASAISGSGTVTAGGFFGGTLTLSGTVASGVTFHRHRDGGTCHLDQR